MTTALYVEDAGITWTGCCCSACPALVRGRDRGVCALLQHGVCGGCTQHAAADFAASEDHPNGPPQQVEVWHGMADTNHMTATQTTGQQFTATLRKAFAIGTRSKDHRDGGSIKADMLQSVENAIYYPGYYGPERTALSHAASGVVQSYRKHVDGYRIDGMLRYQITSMSPWEFAAFLGAMVDAGVTNVGEGERYFQQMARVAA